MLKQGEEQSAIGGLLCAIPSELSLREMNPPAILAANSFSPQWQSRFPPILNTLHTRVHISDPDSQYSTARLASFQNLSILT
jgi:hypothetical protein